MLIIEFTYVGTSSSGQFTNGRTYLILGWVTDASNTLNGIVLQDSGSIGMTGNILNTNNWQLAGQSIAKDTITVYPFVS